MIDEFLKEHFFIILNLAKENHNLTDEQYEDLIFEPLITLDEQSVAYNNLIYHLTANKILKGAEFIESITPNHPKYTAAHEKYDSLVKSLRGMR